MQREFQPLLKNIQQFQKIFNSTDQCMMNENIKRFIPVIHLHLNDQGSKPAEMIGMEMTYQNSVDGIAGDVPGNQCAGNRVTCIDKQIIPGN